MTKREVISVEELVRGVLARDERSISRTLTLIENRSPRALEIQKALYAKTGAAHIIGITGSPGAGKSTLVNQLVRHWFAAGNRVAALAVDPSSPFSGGAVLGDRIRMEEALEQRGIYMRSMATRGALGGLAHAVGEAIDILDAAGFQIVIVETVGVGQGEIDICKLAHTSAVILVPGMGDEVQVMKAGIMEIADVFAINKADRPGANELEKEVRVLLNLSKPQEGAWTPTVVQTKALQGDGITELARNIEGHMVWLRSSSELDRRIRGMVRERIVRIAVEQYHERLLTLAGSELDSLAAACAARQIAPHLAVEQLSEHLKTVLKSSPK